MNIQDALHLLKTSNLEFYRNYKEDFLIFGTTMNYIFSPEYFLKRNADIFMYPDSLGGLSNTKFNTKYVTTRPIKEYHTAQDSFKMFLKYCKERGKPIKLDCKSFALFTYSYLHSIIHPKRKHISIFPEGIFSLIPYYNYSIKKKEFIYENHKVIKCNHEKLSKILPDVSLLYIYMVYDISSLLTYDPNLNGYIGNLFLHFARHNDAQGEWCIWVKELNKGICLTINNGVQELSIKNIYITLLKNLITSFISFVRSSTHVYFLNPKEVESLIANMCFRAFSRDIEISFYKINLFNEEDTIDYKINNKDLKSRLILYSAEFTEEDREELVRLYVREKINLKSLYAEKYKDCSDREKERCIKLGNNFLTDYFEEEIKEHGGLKKVYRMEQDKWKKEKSEYISRVKNFFGADT